MTHFPPFSFPVFRWFWFDDPKNELFFFAGGAGSALEFPLDVDAIVEFSWS
jgi:hypothetical protein